jgi:hypothetical protein
MDAPIMLIQYDKEGQTPEDAPILYPRDWATSKDLYTKPSP